MTNKKRIFETALSQGAYTPEELQEMRNNNIEIPLHTKKRWHKEGYRIRKGMENRGFKTKLWLLSQNNNYYLADVILYSDKMIEKWRG